MRFLLKCVFWLGGVFLLMPGLTSQSPHQAPQNGGTVSAEVKAPAHHPLAQLVEQGVGQLPAQLAPDLIEQWTQAGQSLHDITQFCARNPALCNAGKTAMLQAGQHAFEQSKSGHQAASGTAAQFEQPDRQQPAKAALSLPPLHKIPLPAMRPH